ncbi:hypothetical protein [Candidatus Hydrogenosomobacter endosymbioticus]|uniref:Uncharacterized protein n=1 Tax=Candidatus Hydrogenosomobacter endosymbioticus TaxID=2558174 RepID=A0ABM7V8L2_9PROT|nr:hypothetical protein [Candidatus Hydrogenosomobacter endosymbioticus]BDB96119.1 hypothetical protein HYD_2520 [Candidatus Hydrogenosomobacter endosymbioticus]
MKKFTVRICFVLASALINHNASAARSVAEILADIDYITTIKNEKSDTSAVLKLFQKIDEEKNKLYTAGTKLTKLLCEINYIGNGGLDGIGIGILKSQAKNAMKDEMEKSINNDVDKMRSNIVPTIIGHLTFLENLRYEHIYYDIKNSCANKILADLKAELNEVIQEKSKNDKDLLQKKRNAIASNKNVENMQVGVEKNAEQKAIHEQANQAVQKHPLQSENIKIKPLQPENNAIARIASNSHNEQQLLSLNNNLYSAANQKNYKNHYTYQKSVYGEYNQQYQQYKNEFNSYGQKEPERGYIPNNYREPASINGYGQQNNKMVLPYVQEKKNIAKQSEQIKSENYNIRHRSNSCATLLVRHHEKSAMDQNSPFSYKNIKNAVGNKTKDSICSIDEEQEELPLAIDSEQLYENDHPYFKDEEAQKLGLFKSRASDQKNNDYDLQEKQDKNYQSKKATSSKNENN